jgi:hypothetical protein
MVTLPLAAAFREAYRAFFAPKSLYEQRFWSFFYPSCNGLRISIVLPENIAISCPQSGVSANRRHGFGRFILQSHLDPTCTPHALLDHQGGPKPRAILIAISVRVPHAGAALLTTSGRQTIPNPRQEGE